MANININEISQNYTYNIGNSSYACVALPITSSWGPGYEYSDLALIDLSSEKIENSVWNRFPANQEGLESFVSTYRGPATHYLGRKDFSYQQAMTLLTAGYDVLVCRVSGGDKAKGVVNFSDGETLNLSAKYSGTFGNNLVVNIRKINRRSFNYWNVITYIVDAATSARTAVENINFVFDLEASTDNILHISEVESAFLEFDVANAPTSDTLLELSSEVDDYHVWDSIYRIQSITLLGGTDHPEVAENKDLENELKQLMEAVDAANSDKLAKYDIMKPYHDAEVASHEKEQNAYEAMNASKDAMDTAKTKMDGYKDLPSKIDERDAVLNNPEATDEDKANAEAAYQAFISDHNIEDVTKEEARARYTQFKETYSSHKAEYTSAKAEYTSAKDEYLAAKDLYLQAKADYEAAVEAYDNAVSAYNEKAQIRDAEVIKNYLDRALTCARNRFAYSLYAKNFDNLDPKDQDELNTRKYITVLDEKRARAYDPEYTSDYDITPVNDKNTAMIICRREWMFNAAYSVLDALDDKLAYNPNRVIVPGWDDQDILFLEPTLFSYGENRSLKVDTVSPLHQKLMDVAYYSRCATAYIDIPRSLEKYEVYNDAEDIDEAGYVQKLARLNESLSLTTVNGAFYSSHSAIFAPWGKYMYVGTGKQMQASPSFLALMIDRAMIKNQTSQYEWQLPTNRRNNLRIGKLDYVISKKYLDVWQSLEGVGVNCITRIPDIGLSIWGNSTLYEVPPATYQALANLSTRKLVNAVEDLAYRCGIAITFQYNNDQAYNAFYAGMTPLLDTMRNVGAITDYYLRMAEDVNGLDQVNANSVVGKIYLVIDGVINDINIDLIALPPQTSLDEYRA